MFLYKCPLQHRLLASLIAVAGFALLLLNGCRRDPSSSEPVKRHADYIRADSGLTLTYAVDSLYYDKFHETIDTYTYEMQATIQGRTNPEGIQWKSLIRDSSGTVRERGTLYTAELTRDDYRIFRKNERVVKLSFPVKTANTWNGHAYSRKSAQSFRYKQVHEPFTGKYNRFDSTVTVIEKDAENLIEHRYREVVYAKQIGKVYKETMHLRYEGDSIPPERISWEEKANSGYIIRQQLKSYHLP